LLSVYPHCHYLGQDWEIFAITPLGDTINVIRIDEWDFNWQGAYTFDRLKKIPAGSMLHINATYDNTTNNPFNPSSPPQSVSWGSGTTDEMYLVVMNFVPYQEGDEDIVVGGTIITNIEEVGGNNLDKLYTPFPNPTNGAVTLNYFLSKKQNISIEIFDLKGSLVKTIFNSISHTSGNHKVDFSTAELPLGTYKIRLEGEGVLLSKPLVVIK